MLVCLNRKSQGSPLLAANRVFCVNTLAAGQEAISNMFAGRTGATLADRFQVGEWTTLTTGAPVLSAAIVACDCRVVEIKAVASHNVIFGAVVDIRIGPAGPGLLYHQRAYKLV